MMDNKTLIETDVDIKEENTAENDCCFSNGDIKQEQDPDDCQNYESSYLEVCLKEEQDDIKLETPHEAYLKQDYDDLYEVKEEIDIEYDTENDNASYERNESTFETDSHCSYQDNCHDSPNHSTGKPKQNELHGDEDHIEHINENTGKKKRIRTVSDKRYECEDCNITYKHKDNLSRHIKLVHEKIRHQCELCNKSFSKKSYLVTHMESVHSNIKHECTLCHKIFNFKGGLRRHMKTAHLKIRYDCEICHKTFYLQHYLDRHVESMHNEDHIKHECQICHKTYNFKESLERHMNSIHTERDKCQCEICHKLFVCERTLNTHMKAIHGNSKYECEMCDKTFKHQQYLYTHVKKVHDKRKPI